MHNVSELWTRLRIWLIILSNLTAIITCHQTARKRTDISNNGVAIDNNEEPPNGGQDFIALIKFILPVRKLEKREMLFDCRVAS